MDFRYSIVRVAVHVEGVESTVRLAADHLVAVLTDAVRQVLVGQLIL